jgi:ABC-type polysaccharide/polyol phosphate export permease
MTMTGYCYVLVISLVVFFLGVLVFKAKEGEMVEDL